MSLCVFRIEVDRLGAVGNSTVLLTLFTSICVYTMLCLGLNIVVGYAGLLDLGYSAFFAIECDRFGIIGNGAVVLTLVGVSEAPVVEGFEECRVQFDGFRAIGNGAIILTRVGVCKTSIVIGIGVFRIELYCLAEVRNRPFIFTLVDVSDAAAIIGDGKILLVVLILLDDLCTATNGEVCIRGLIAVVSRLRQGNAACEQNNTNQSRNESEQQIFPSNETVALTSPRGCCQSRGQARGAPIFQAAEKLALVAATIHYSLKNSQ